MEIETHHAETHDSFSKIVGVQAAMLAMLLSIFSILSHKTNTDSIILVNESSNQWAHYQAKRIRDYQLELNIKLLQLIAPNNPQSNKTLEEYAQEQKKYRKDLDDIKIEADKTEEKSDWVHHQTGYFELSEGLLEISVILTSLFFLSRKKFFPALGLLLGATGVILGVLGLLLHH